MFSKCTIQVVICLAGFSFLSGQTALGQGPGNGGNVQTVPIGELRDLMVQLQSTASIDVKSQVEVTLLPEIALQPACAIPVPADSLSVPIAGRLEFRASDARHWTLSQVDQEHMPWMSVEVAYDGTKYQLLRSDGTLSIGPVDSAAILPALPNPVMQLVQFRYPLNDANAATEFRLQDVWNDQVPESFWNVSWEQIVENGFVREAAVFPGGVYEGRSYVHRVIVPVTRRRTPVRIERIDDQGNLLTSAEFSDYRKITTVSGDGWWPHRIVLKAFAESNVMVGQIAHTITDLSVDATMSQESFVIDPSKAARVWDDVQSQFVQAE